MPDLPRGTVTFAFTDIEGSTELLKHLGDGYADVLSGHRRIIREAFAASEGIEIDMQGDAFFFVFPRARDALAAAVEAQRGHASANWPEGSAVRVRMGLHTGEPALHEEGYVGLDVVRAARICTVGRGGQILLSEATRALLGSGMPEGVSVFPLGQRHLRGIDEPERVFEVAIEGLEEAPAEEPAPGRAPAPEPTQASPAPPPRTGSKAAPPGDLLGTRLAGEIQERVLSRLEEKLGRAEARSARAGRSSGADEIAERVASLTREIEARISAALEKGGPSRP
jgi:class 3 adenylate cyclase